MPGQNRDGTDRQLINQDRTFFCSELQAKASKILGILQNDNTSSSRFHPVHFSAKGESFLKLTPNTILEEELQIIIDSVEESDPLAEYNAPVY